MENWRVCLGASTIERAMESLEVHKNRVETDSFVILSSRWREVDVECRIAEVVIGQLCHQRVQTLIMSRLGVSKFVEQAQRRKKK